MVPYRYCSFIINTRCPGELELGIQPAQLISHMTCSGAAFHLERRRHSTHSWRGGGALSCFSVCSKRLPSRLACGAARSALPSRVPRRPAPGGALQLCRPRSQHRHRTAADGGAGAAQGAPGSERTRRVRGSLRAFPSCRHPAGSLCLPQTLPATPASAGRPRPSPPPPPPACRPSRSPVRAINCSCGR